MSFISANGEIRAIWSVFPNVLYVGYVLWRPDLSGDLCYCRSPNLDEICGTWTFLQLADWYIQAQVEPLLWEAATTQ